MRNAATGKPHDGPPVGAAPYDPELADALTQLPTQPRIINTGADLERARALRRAERADDVALSRNGAVAVAEISIAGPDRQLSLLVLSPTSTPSPWPCLLHFHGGGLTMGDNRLGAEQLAGWAGELGIVAVSVEYRLAPENPYPAAVHDCYASLMWVGTHGAEMGIDCNRLIIFGSSAGGGLAAAVALMARDQRGPAIANLMLQYPMLDDRNVTSSSHESVAAGLWDRAANTASWSAYLGPAVGAQDVSPYAAPSRATNLVGLPPTYIEVGQADLFRDETLEFATRLAKSSVPVELHLWPGAWHGFDQKAPRARISRQASATRRQYVERATKR